MTGQHIARAELTFKTRFLKSSEKALKPQFRGDNAARSMLRSAAKHPFAE